MCDGPSQTTSLQAKAAFDRAAVTKGDTPDIVKRDITNSISKG